MSVDADPLEQKLGDWAITRLSVDTHHITESEPSSVTSSEPPSPNLLNETDSDVLPSKVTRSQSKNYARNSITPSTTSSSASLPTTASIPTANVKFAPLPAIGPRRRRSNQPLGMAARAQLVRRRRGLQAEDHQIIQQEGDDVVVVSNSVWTSPEFEEQRRRVEILAARHAQIQANNAAMEVEDMLNQPEEEEKPRKKRSINSSADEPVYSLRKMVKGAGLTLWKKVSSKEIAAIKEKEEQLEMSKVKKLEEVPRQRTKSDPERPKAPILRRSSTPPLPIPILRPGLNRLNTDPPASTSSSVRTPIQSAADVRILVDSDVQPDEVGGGVWEEEIGDTFGRNPLQNDADDTATIIATLDIKCDSPPPPPIAEPPSQTHSPPLPDSIGRTHISAGP